MKNHQKKTEHAAPTIPAEIINHPERRIRLPEVKALTGYSTASIYAKMADGSFPPAQKMGGRAVAWKMQSVIDWLNDRPTSTEMGGVA